MYVSDFNLEELASNHRAQAIGIKHISPGGFTDITANATVL